MSLTTSPKSRIASHSTGWRVMRLLADRAAKSVVEGPEQWGIHRRIMNHPEHVRYIAHQFDRLTELYKMRGRRA